MEFLIFFYKSLGVDIVRSGTRFNRVNFLFRFNLTPNLYQVSSHEFIKSIFEID